MNLRTVCVAAVLVSVVAGCSAAAPEIHSSSPAPVTAPAIQPQSTETGFTRIIAGSGDSISAVPGSAGAPYRIRFKQTAPASDRFTFYDRDLSFYFRPTPSVLFFQIENKQNKPVSIDWSRSTFYTPSGTTQRIANSSTRWDQRFQAQAMMQIAGLRTYSDYLIPLTALVDPAENTEQMHRMLLPEDEQAMQYTSRPFGVDLVIMVDDKPRTYPFRFEVVSVIRQ